MPYLRSAFTPTTGSTIMIKTTSSSFFNNEVTLTDGTTTLTSSFDADGVCIFSNVFLTGELTASSVNGSNVIGEVINIPHVGVTIMRNAIVASTTLNDNSWSTIQAIAKKGSGAAYWNVGDRKQIKLTGSVRIGGGGYGYNLYVFILGFNHNQEKEGTAIHFQIGFSTLTGGGFLCGLQPSNYGTRTGTDSGFSMNDSNTNAGGWASCAMRTVIMPQVKANLPSDLQSVLKAVTKYTDNVGGAGNVESNITATQDEIFLIGSSEIYPDYILSNPYEKKYQKQYSYFALGNSRVTYKYPSSEPKSSNIVKYWFRSPKTNSGYYFCYQNNSDYDASNPSYGLSANSMADVSYHINPIFTVG